VLTWVQASAGSKEERALVDGARQASDIFARLSAGQSRLDFRVGGDRQGLALEREALVEIVRGSFRGAESRAADVRARVVEEAGRRLRGAAAEMSRPPTGEPRLDRPTRDAVSSEPSQLGSLLRVQNEAIADAKRYGTRQQYSIVGLGMVAIAGALLGFAALVGPGAPGRLVLVAGGGLLLIALAGTLIGTVLG
jgi:hypothetical protein